MSFSPGTDHCVRAVDENWPGQTEVAMQYPSLAAVISPAAHNIRSLATRSALVRPRRVDRRAILIGAFVLFLALLTTHGRRDSNLDWRLAVVAGPTSFDLIRWEAVTLTRRVQTALFPPPDSADPVSTVLDYFGLTDQVNRLTGQRDQ